MSHEQNPEYWRGRAHCLQASIKLWGKEIEHHQQIIKKLEATVRRAHDEHDDAISTAERLEGNGMCACGADSGHETTCAETTCAACAERLQGTVQP